MNMQSNPRQLARAGWYDEADTIVYIAPENVETFLEGLAKQSRE